VIATDAAGVRVAIEHTRLFAFEGHKEQEEILRPIAGRLEADPRLDQSGRRYELFFFPKFLGRLLKGFQPQVADVLTEWAATTLPTLPVRERVYRRDVPIMLPDGKEPRIRVEVAVVQRSESIRPVSVSGYLPDDPQRMVPLIERALKTKLPKLLAASAHERVLLLELPTTDSEWKVIETIRGMRTRFPLLASINYIVVADTFALRSDDYVVFWVWDLARNDWSEILQPVLTEPATLPARSSALAALSAQARSFAAAAKAANTVRAYQSDWNDFRQWCDAHELPTLPAEPETVALYLTDRAATLKTSSLARRLTTISRAHQAAGHSSPAAMRHAIVSEVWKGIQRKKGTAEAGKTPFLTTDLKQVIDQLPADLQGMRDRALLLTGFAGGFRRSELAALTTDDLQETAEGIVVRLRRSKTDQEGQGRPVALPYGSDPRTCPVRALRAWLEAAAIGSGAVFRAVDQFGLVSESRLHPDSIGWIVKRAARRGGLAALDYAGHSLRAGLATQAAMNGASELAIMKQTGHRSLATVRKYIRDGALFRDNAATKLGL
jgi:site-specific recombinase XerD